MVDDKKNLAKKLKTGKKHERQHKTKTKTTSKYHKATH